MPKTAVAIRHVHFEDLGTFAPVLAREGYGLSYVDVWRDGLGFDPLAPDLLIVLGAPVGVYETEAYPFLGQERALLKARLAANRPTHRPTLGICLGAQQIAASLGASVKPSGIKEIGFAPLSLTEAGKQSALRHLEGQPVLHWHGDTFAIPDGATHLAATALCAHQAFAIGPNVLGLQFHPEADTQSFEAWLIGHAAEIAGAGIAPQTLRQDAARYGDALRNAGQAMLGAWLNGLKG